MKMNGDEQWRAPSQVWVDVQPDSLARYRASGTKNSSGQVGSGWCGDTQCGDAGARPTRRQLRRPARASVWTERDAKLAELAARNYVMQVCWRGARVYGQRELSGTLRSCMRLPSHFATHSPSPNWLAHLAATIERARHTASCPLARWLAFAAGGTNQVARLSIYPQSGVRGVSDAPVKSRSVERVTRPRPASNVRWGGIEHVRPHISRAGVLAAEALRRLGL